MPNGGIKKNHKTSLPSWDDSFVSDSTEKFIISHNWDELRKIMWNYVGIVRSNKRLHIAKEKIKLIEFDDVEFNQLAERSPEYMCGTLKDHSENIISLQKCYDYFNRFKMKRRIMKLIKRNLI